MRAPSGVASDGNVLAVADTNNNRVLLWLTMPMSSSTPPDVVLGQPDFTTVTPGTSATKMRGPQGVWVDEGKLFVADTQNSRVLIWNSIPTSNAASPNVVLGQPDFDTRPEPDLTQSNFEPSATNMLDPVSVTTSNGRMFVSDLGFERVECRSGTFELSRFPGKGSFVLAGPALELGEACVGGPQLLATEPTAEGQQLGAHVVVTGGIVRLALEGPDLAFELAEDVLQALHVTVGPLESAQRAVLAKAVLEDAGGFLDDGTMVLWLGVEDRGELALAHDDVLVSADTGVGQELLDVEEATVGPVDLVVGGAVAVEAAGDGDLVEVERERPASVVEEEGDLGPAQLGSGGRPGEDEVLHLLGAERARRLRAHDPGQGVDHVRLA